MGVAPPLLSPNYSCHLSPRQVLTSCSDSVSFPRVTTPRFMGLTIPVYYGPKDTPFGEVKVGELPKWLARRDKSISGIGKAISRSYSRYCHNYVFPKRTKIAPVVHFFLGASVFFYLINYTKMAHHRRYKYHW